MIDVRLSLSSCSTFRAARIPIRTPAVAATGDGLLAPELAAGIAGGRSAESIGVRPGKWLTLRQANARPTARYITTTQGLRDRSIIAVLLGCALRRSEVAALPDGHRSGAFAPEATVAARHANTTHARCGDAGELYASSACGLYWSLKHAFQGLHMHRLTSKLFLLTVAAAAQQPPNPPTPAPKDFAIIAWGDAPSNVTQLHWMHDAGLNIAGFCHADDLDKIRDAGLSCFLSDPRLSGYDWEKLPADSEIRSRIGDVAKQIGSNPAVMGFYLLEGRSRRGPTHGR